MISGHVYIEHKVNKVGVLTCTARADREGLKHA